MTTRTGKSLAKLIAVVAVVMASLAMTTQPVGERDRTESKAIGILRAISSGQAAYTAATGYYDRLECLASAACAPGLAGPFIDPQIATSRASNGYRLIFYAGPKAEPSGRAMSPSAILRFAAVAIPSTPGTTGRHGFCVHDAEQIYVSTNEPHVEDGRCQDRSRTIDTLSR